MTMSEPDSPAGAISFSFRVADFTRLSVDARELDSEAKPRRQAILLADCSFTGHLPSDTACCFTTAPAADARDGENIVNRNAYISEMCLQHDV